MTGFYTFSPVHACKLVQPSNRGEYEISEAIDLLIQSGRTIDAIGLDGWRIDVRYSEDRDEAERRLQGGRSGCCRSRVAGFESFRTHHYRHVSAA